MLEDLASNAVDDAATTATARREQRRRARGDRAAAARARRALGLVRRLDPARRARGRARQGAGQDPREVLEHRADARRDRCRALPLTTPAHSRHHRRGMYVGTYSALAAALFLLFYLTGHAATRRLAPLPLGAAPEEKAALRLVVGVAVWGTLLFALAALQRLRPAPIAAVSAAAAAWGSGACGRRERAEPIRSSPVARSCRATRSRFSCSPSRRSRWPRCGRRRCVRSWPGTPTSITSRFHACTSSTAGSAAFRSTSIRTGRSACSFSTRWRWWSRTTSWPPRSTSGSESC